MPFVSITRLRVRRWRFPTQFLIDNRRFGTVSSNHLRESRST
jgi:hypothetical protein